MAAQTKTVTSHRLFLMKTTDGRFRWFSLTRLRTALDSGTRRPVSRPPNRNLCRRRHPQIKQPQDSAHGTWRTQPGGHSHWVRTPFQAMISHHFPFTKTHESRITLIAAAFLYLLATPNSTHASTLYVTNFTGDTVGEYDGSTGETINPSFPTGSFSVPQGIALDTFGHLFVVSTASDWIGEYSASTGATINATLVTGLDGPVEIALDGSGHLYVANFNGNTIGEYNATTGAVINAALITGLNNPEGMALDSAGHLFVANWNGNTIGEYNASTGMAINPTFVNTGLDQPQGLALDGSGHLYVANSGYSGGTNGNTIGEYDAGTGAVINPTLITGLQLPHWPCPGRFRRSVCDQLRLRRGE